MAGDSQGGEFGRVDLDLELESETVGESDGQDVGEGTAVRGMREGRGRELGDPERVRPSGSGSGKLMVWEHVLGPAQADDRGRERQSDDEQVKPPGPSPRRCGLEAIGAMEQD